MTIKFLPFLLLVSLGISAQTKIEIVNKSFEDFPRQGQSFLSLGGWTDCGGFRFTTESPPDVHPGNFWDNVTPPSQGKSYLGMVVRDNDSWEGIGQRLTLPLKAGKCYKFTVDLARSQSYMSGSKKTGPETKINYITPSVLRIWSGNGICDDRELLGESITISHADWRTYQFKVKPKADYQSIMIEAFYKVPVIAPYCGHVLVDNLSDFEEIDCDAKLASVISKVTGKAIVDASDTKSGLPPHKKNRLDNEKPPINPNSKPAVTNKPPVVANNKAKVLEDLDIKKIKQGAIINVKNLYFKADTSAIDRESYSVLDEIYDFLKSNKNVRVEIGGHTNGIPPHEYCDKLSASRAKAVYEYLTMKGIPKEQLTFHGYGKRALITSDSTPSGRTKNQRVELKILSLG